MRAAAAILCILPVVAVAEPREIAVVTINNEDARLFDDGTWAFIDPKVTMPDVDAPRCLGSADERISFCPDPAYLDNQVVTLLSGIEEHTFQTVDQGFTLVAAYDTSFGHGGDLVLYAQGTSADDSLFARLASRALGMGAYTEQSFVLEDIAIMLSQYNEPNDDYSMDAIEVMLENQTLYLDLVSVPSIVGFNEKPAGFDLAAARAAATQNLYESITIDGKSLAAIIQEVQE